MFPGIQEHVAIVESETFKGHNTRRLLDYLTEKRGSRPRPMLSDIDFMEIRDIAPSMCIRDVVEGGEDLRCRYWGEQFIAAYQLDCTNKLISETYAREAAQKTLAFHRRALAASMPLRLVGSLGYFDRKRDHVVFEGIMSCLDGKDGPKQHVIAVGQFRYRLDDEDRALLESQCPDLVL